MSYPLTNLAPGYHQVFVRDSNSVVSPRDAATGLPTGKYYVDPTLPFDPMSLTFTNQQGEVIHPPTLNWSRDLENIIAKLHHNEIYQISIDTCLGEQDLAITLMLDDTLLTRLSDDDGDGRYTGRYTVDLPARSIAAAASLRFVVAAQGVEQTFGSTVSTPPVGIIRDGVNGQSLDEASVLALFSASDSTYLPLPPAITTTPNQQVTGADGAYGFTVAEGLYRLDVVRDGYQPYRSDNIVSNDGSLAVDLNLSPAVTEPATQIIYITENGFTPAVVTVEPGSVIMWVNTDLTDHTSSLPGTWESGLLEAGATFKTKLDAWGTYTYQDSTDSANSGLVIVEAKSVPGNTHQIFLPLVSK
jgi:plastocyanin